jgi:ring-1,2-phenylacetyl-CoA epoxidase subunit PaaE
VALHFHSLTVKDVRKETSDCVSIGFTIPEPIKNDFHFKQGQNITVRSTIRGEEIRRSYSICSSPLEGELRVAVKAAYNGIFSSFAHQQLQAGDQLEVLPPTGNFYTEVAATNQKNYVFFAAGSGITPVISSIKTILACELSSTITLLYGNRRVASIIFKEVLESLKNKYMQRLSIYYILSREKTETAINYGRIDAAKCGSFSRIIDFPSFDEFFICGPQAMIFSVKSFLTGQGADPAHIHFELFTTPGKDTTRPTIAPPSGQGSEVTVICDGRSFDFRLNSGSKPILDAALAAGADLPFACKGGVCTTCKAKILEGEVTMDVNYGLEPDEVTSGFILTCQSHPVSAKVVVSFDNK